MSKIAIQNVLFMFLIVFVIYGFISSTEKTLAVDNNVSLSTEVQEYIAISVTAGGTIAFGNLTPGSPLKGANGSTISVTTSATNGYKLYISDSVAGNNSALLHTDTSTYIADYAGTIAAPTTWSGTGLGFSLYAGTNKDVKWGTGITFNDANNKYAGVSQNNTEIMNKTGYSEAADISYIGWEVDVSNNQKTGDYSGNVIISATATVS